MGTEYLSDGCVKRSLRSTNQRQKPVDGLEYCSCHPSRPLDHFSPVLGGRQCLKGQQQSPINLDIWVLNFPLLVGCVNSRIAEPRFRFKKLTLISSYSSPKQDYGSTRVNSRVVQQQSIRLFWRHHVRGRLL